MSELVFILICLLLNGFFAAIEIAFISVRKSHMQKLAQDGNHNAAIILSMKNKPERFLSIIQICITLVGFLSAALVGIMAKNNFSPLLVERFGLSPLWAEYIVIFMSVIGLAYFSVVIGELVPKSLALRYPQKIILWAAPFLKILNIVLSKVITVFEISTKVIIRIFTFPLHPAEQPAKDSVDLGGLSGQAQEYIQKLVGLDAHKAKDILLPWDKTITLNANTDIEEVKKQVIACGHTRLPVTKDNKVVGVLNSKEFHAYLTGDSKESWLTIVRPYIAIPQDMPLVKALKKLQEQRHHLGIVYDQEKILGILTIEDILEEVIGDVFDEDDDGSLLRLIRTGQRYRYF